MEQPSLQILVVVANIQECIIFLKTEVEKGSMSTLLAHGSVDPKIWGKLVIANKVEWRKGKSFFFSLSLLFLKVYTHAVSKGKLVNIPVPMMACKKWGLCVCEEEGVKKGLNAHIIYVCIASLFSSLSLSLISPIHRQWC